MREFEMKNLATILPALYTVENEPDPLVKAKLFMPDGPGTWFLLEFDPSDRVVFCYADLGIPGCAELGYSSLDEIESIRGALGLKVELDEWWEPCPLSEVTSGVRR